MAFDSKDRVTDFACNTLQFESDINSPVRKEEIDYNFQFSFYVDTNVLLEQGILFAKNFLKSSLDPTKVLGRTRNDSEKIRLLVELYIYSLYKGYIYGYYNNVRLEENGYLIRGHDQLRQLMRVSRFRTQTPGYGDVTKVFYVTENHHIHNMQVMSQFPFLNNCLRDEGSYKIFESFIYDRILTKMKSQVSANKAKDCDLWLNTISVDMSSIVVPENCFLGNSVLINVGNNNKQLGWVFSESFKLQQDDVIICPALFITIISEGNSLKDYSQFSIYHKTDFNNLNTKHVRKYETSSVTGMKVTGVVDDLDQELKNINFIINSPIISDLNEGDDTSLKP
jgi:hypothetical protein